MEFSLDILDCVNQPVLVVHQGLLTHCNPAAGKLLAGGEQEIAQFLDEQSLEIYEKYDGVGTINLFLELPQGAYSATVRREKDVDLFFATPVQTATMPLHTLQLISNSLRKHLDTMFSATDLLVRHMEYVENDHFLSLVSPVTRGMYQILRLAGNLGDGAMYLEKNRPLYGKRVEIPEFFAQFILELEGFCGACQRNFTSKTNFKQLVGYMDIQQVSRLIFNLVSNAISATQPGGTINLNLETTGQQLSIRVEDDGKGIDADQWKNLFSNFSTMQVIEMAGKGLGLGLPMARQIAICHGGNLVVTSAPQGGTKVIATINLGLTPQKPSISATKSNLDYTGGHPIGFVELSDNLPAEEFISFNL